MNKVIKYLLIFFLVSGLLITAFYGVGILAFDGAFDKKYSRAELTANFLKNESAFSDAVSYFRDIIPPDLSYTVTFGISRGKKISLYLSPFVTDPSNPILGGETQHIESPKLHSVLKELGWTKETLLTLSHKLAQTNCDWIRTAGDNTQVQLYPGQDGWGSFRYYVCPHPVTDSLNKDYGVPLSHTGFGRFVTLNYSSAL